MMPALHSLLFGAVAAALLTGFITLARTLGAHGAELRGLKDRQDATEETAQAQRLPERLYGLETRCSIFHPGTGPVPVVPQPPFPGGMKR